VSVFGKVSPLTVSSVTPTSVTVTWGAPPEPYPAPFNNYDVPLCAGAALGPVLQRQAVGSSEIAAFTGLTPGTEYTVGVRAQAFGGKNSGPWVTTTITTASLTAISQAQVTAMLNFMLAQKGKPYLSENPQRFGPAFYDCSGLVYAATQAADVPLPQSKATADVEMGWFASQQGAYIVPGIPELQAGDIVGCYGASPSPVTVNGHTYYIGHIGMMADSTNLISALNAKDGVALMNVNYLQPMLAVRVQA
jgi:cell wall-associated NlpC family hydrolase